MMLNEEEFYDAVETALDKHDEEDDENDDVVKIAKIRFILHGDMPVANAQCWQSLHILNMIVLRAEIVSANGFCKSKFMLFFDVRNFQELTTFSSAAS